MLCCWRCARHTACCTTARCCWEAAGRGGGGWRWDVFSGTSLKKRSYSRKRNELNALLLLARCRGLSHTWLEFLKDVLADWGHTGNKAGCRHCSALLLPGHAGVCLGCPMGVPWVRPGCAKSGLQSHAPRERARPVHIHVGTCCICPRLCAGICCLTVCPRGAFIR